MSICYHGMEHDLHPSASSHLPKHLPHFQELNQQGPLNGVLHIKYQNQESVFPAKEISMESAKESRSLKSQAVNVGENHGIPENQRCVVRDLKISFGNVELTTKKESGDSNTLNKGKTVEDMDPSEDNRKFMDEVCIGPSCPQETVNGAAVGKVHEEGVKLRKEKDRPLGRLMGLAKEISAMVVDTGPTTIRP
ncbi:hypothetical protein QYF36_005738 [Acer negundo]|nr:hypothetical protein QYF36_005738 [Acer negundo]